MDSQKGLESDGEKQSSGKWKHDFLIFWYFFRDLWCLSCKIYSWNNLTISKYKIQTKIQTMLMTMRRLMVTDCEYMKIIYVTADKEVNVKAIFAVKNTTRTVVKIRPEKNSALYRNWTHDLCDTGQCSTNWAYKLCFYLIVCMRTCKQIRLHFY